MPPEHRPPRDEAKIVRGRRILAKWRAKQRHIQTVEVLHTPPSRPAPPQSSVDDLPTPDQLFGDGARRKTSSNKIPHGLTATVVAPDDGCGTENLRDGKPRVARRKLCFA
jgi:hypothetical protein